MRFNFKKTEAEQIDAFWEWFQSAEGARTLQEVWIPGKSSDAAVRVGKQLSKIKQGLAWGALCTKDKHYQLEISPGGLRENLALVKEILARAPIIPGWTLVAFKQPLSNPYFVYEDRYKVVNEEVLCRMTGGRDELTDLNVYLPLPNGIPDQTLRGIGWTALDHNLGEEVVMTKIGAIFWDIVANAPDSAFPLPELLKRIIPDS